MQAILQNPSLTQTLFETILESPNGRRSLCRLARTCKALKEPSLNMLWRDLDSLTPLLSVMRGQLFKRARRPGQGFIKMPEEEDWNKLLAYGERVRRLTYNEAAGNIAPSIFSVFEDYRPQDFVLPYLTTLVWKAETPEGLQRSALFVNPDLQNVVLEAGGRIFTPDLDAFLTEISAECRLNSLSINAVSKLPNTLTRLFPPNTPLQSVGLMAPGATSAPVGRWLMSMPTLKNLQLDVAGRTDDEISSFFEFDGRHGRSRDPRTPDSGVFSGEESETFTDNVLDKAKARMSLLQDSGARKGFRQLRNLKLIGNASAVSSFLERTHAMLRSLELTIDSPEDVSTWKTLCAAIQQQFWQTLEVLQISASIASKFNDLIRSTPRADVSSWRLVMDGFEFLPHLRILEIDLSDGVAVHARDVQQIAAACPSLEILKICPLSRWPTATGPPPLQLGDLIPLMDNCRHLHTLAIPVNASDVFDEDNTTPESSSDSLLRFHAGHSWVGDPLRASITLSHLAPYLESLKWFHEKNRPGYIENNSMGWQKISEMLPLLQRLRHFERQYVRTVVVEAPQPILPQIPQRTFADKVVDAVVSRTLIDHAVMARPATKQRAVQVKPKVHEMSVGTEVEVVAQAVDATPEVRHMSIATETEVIETPKSLMSPMKSEKSEYGSAQSFTDESGLTEMSSLDEKGSIRASRRRSDSGNHGLFSTVFQTVRSLSPSLLVRLFDMFTSASIPSRSPSPKLRT